MYYELEERKEVWQDCLEQFVGRVWSTHELQDSVSEVGREAWEHYRWMGCTSAAAVPAVEFDEPMQT